MQHSTLDKPFPLTLVQPNMNAFPFKDGKPSGNICGKRLSMIQIDFLSLSEVQ